MRPHHGGLVNAPWAASLAGLIALLGGSQVATADPWSFEDETSASRLGNANQGRLYRPLIIRFEAAVLGGTLVLEQDDVIEASVGGFVADGRAEARGGSGRMLLGYGNFYSGFDLGALAWRGGPAVRSPDATGTFEAGSEAATSSGMVMLGSFFIGTQYSIGRFIVGGELGVGFNLGWNDSGTLEDAVPEATFARVALPARARAGVWLTRHVSLLGTVGTDLANRGGHEVGLAIGFSTGAWDGQR